MSYQQIQYIKGFNSGYLLAKHMPTLFAKIVKNVTPIDEFSEGLFSGKEEYELEYSKIQADDLRNLRYKSQSRDKGHERE